MIHWIETISVFNIYNSTRTLLMPQLLIITILFAAGVHLFSKCFNSCNSDQHDTSNEDRDKPSEFRTRTTPRDTPYQTHRKNESNFRKSGQSHLSSAKNSRREELLIQDTLALDINNKDIRKSEVFFGCRVLSLMRGSFPVRSFIAKQQQP